MIDVCCLQEVRWREQGSRVLLMEELYILSIYCLHG